jgi:hypothetical protein
MQFRRLGAGLVQILFFFVFFGADFPVNIPAESSDGFSGISGIPMTSINRSIEKALAAAKACE